ncbi:ABC-2 family transporter protein [Paenibacillus sp. FSL L8-0340]|uniref:ABC transporter permease n=1 Tax=Paenibacillus sp. FSL L8-0340 TaxID=2954685 RepID=UPI003159218E
MRIFWSFSRQAFHNTAIYRFDFWLQLVTVWFMSYSVYWIWNSLYAQNPSSFEVSLEQMVTYGILGMAFETIFAPGKGPQTYIASQVQTGLIHSDLMKPIDFQVHMLARNFGETFFRFCALVIPSLVISYVFFDLSIPKHISTIVLFTISIVFGYLVLFSLNFLIGLLAIITLDIRSIGWAYNALLRFFSGQMVPLWLFPGVLVGVAEFLPFKSIYYTPLSIYIEKLSGISALKAIMFQLIWIIILFFIGRLIWNRIHLRLTVQGG